MVTAANKLSGSNVGVSKTTPKNRLSGGGYTPPKTTTKNIVSSGGGGGSSGPGYKSEYYTKAGITRSEWTQMNAAARSKVAQYSSEGRLSTSTGKTQTTARSLTIVNREGVPQDKYTVVTERFSVKDAAQARVRGVSEPGTYERNTIYKQNVNPYYENFGTGVNVPKKLPGKVTGAPFGQVILEQATGRGMTVTTQKNVVEGSNIFKKSVEETRTTFTPRSVAQAQLLNTKERIVGVNAAGENVTFSTEQLSRTDFVGSGGRVISATPIIGSPQRTTYTVVEKQEVPFKGWRETMERPTFKAVTTGLERGGAWIEQKGLEIKAQQYPGSKYAARNKLATGTGQLWVTGGQFVTGTGKYIREEPVRLGVDVAAGILTAGASKYLSTAAQFGSKTAFFGNFAVKSAAALGLGYYAASEGTAIYKSERPGERAALTALDIGAFKFGSKIGGTLIPTPTATGQLKITSTKGVTSEINGQLTGSVTRKGYATYEWFGKTRKAPFTTSEVYGGGKVTGSVKYAGSKPYTYSGTIVGTGGDLGATMAKGAAGQQLTMYRPTGVEKTSVSRAGGGQYGIYGQSANTPSPGKFYGTVTGGRASITVVPTRPPTGGLFTYATGGAAESFRPGDFSGFIVGGGSESGALPSIFSGSAAPKYGALPSIGGITGAFNVPSSSMIFGFSSALPKREVSVYSQTSPIAALSAQTKVGTTPLSMVQGLSTTKADQIVQPIAESTSFAETTSVTDFYPESGTIIRDNVNYITDITFIEPPPPIEQPFGGFALPFGGGRIGGGRGGGRQPSFKTGYNPSLAAEVFKIRGTRQQGLRSARTGIGIRPIIGRR